MPLPFRLNSGMISTIALFMYVLSVQKHFEFSMMVVSRTAVADVVFFSIFGVTMPANICNVVTITYSYPPHGGDAGAG